MKRIISIALASTLATSTVAVTASGASAGGHRNYGHGPGHSHHHVAPQTDASGALAAGMLFGFAFGAIASMNSAPYYDDYASPPPPRRLYPVYAVANQHVEWCLAMYDTYDIETDTWVDLHGNVRACAPY